MEIMVSHKSTVYSTTEGHLLHTEWDEKGASNFYMGWQGELV